MRELRLASSEMHLAVSQMQNPELHYYKSTLGIIKWEENWLVWIVIVWLVQVGIDLRGDVRGQNT